MTEEKKTISLLRGDKQKQTSSLEADIFLRNPEALKEHINTVAAVDAKAELHNPEKPATRVTSLDSFLTMSPLPSLSFKRHVDTSFETEGNVKAFTRQNDNKSRKK
jgi:hypothetical protein